MVIPDLKMYIIKGLVVLVLVEAVLCVALRLDAKAVRLERDLALSQVGDLSRVIDGVNRKVAEWKAAADRQAKAAGAARELAEEIRVKGERRIAQLEAAVVPGGCVEAVRWGADQVLLTVGGVK